MTAVNNETALGLSLCRLQCHETHAGTLWPIPSGNFVISNQYVKVDIDRVTFKTDNFKKEPEYYEMAKKRFEEMLVKKIPNKYSWKNGGVSVIIEIIVKSDDMSKTIS